MPMLASVAEQATWRHPSEPRAAPKASGARDGP